MAKLHRMFQAAMGWTDSHLHVLPPTAFSTRGLKYVVASTARTPVPPKTVAQRKIEIVVVVVGLVFLFGFLAVVFLSFLLGIG